jgi:hypothetical protein
VPVTVNPSGGMNCYWPMPFRRSARVTVENQGVSDLGGFFYQISYALVPRLPDEAALFHAHWRRSNPNPLGEDHVLLDGVRGRGHYAGSYLAWTPLSNGWWGEGEIKLFIDGDGEFPTICGTGAEDYVGGTTVVPRPGASARPTAAPTSATRCSITRRARCARSPSSAGTCSARCASASR